MDSYKTIRTSGQGEYVEKKSRFIGAVFHAETLEEAESYLAAARKKYYDARHNCFACVVGTPGTPEEIVRTGGLVRAYTAAVKAALENAEIIEVIRGTELVIRVTYPQAGKLQYVFARENLPACEIEYGQDVIMHQFVPRQDVQRIRKLVIENTDGKAEFLEENEKEYTQKSCHR